MFKMASKTVAAKEIPTISMFFSATDQPCFGQYACVGFNGWNRKGLRRIVSTVAMVTSNIANV